MAPTEWETNRAIAKGAVWMVFARMSIRGLSIVSTIILARLLVPADFGLVAMAMAVLAMLELLKSFSFDMALIQNRDADRAHYDTTWTLNLLASGIIALALFGLSWPAASFYGDDRLVSIFHLLALGAAISGFENVGTVAFRKELQFHREFGFLAGKKLAGFLVTVPLAFWLRNYWALVIGSTLSGVAGVILSYGMHPYRPRFTLVAVRELLSFSSWLMANNMLHFLNSRAVEFILGKTAGPRPLGLFNLSYEIATLPATELVAPVNRAAFPGYVKLAGDRDALRRSYVKIMKMFAVVAIPAAAGISVCAPLLVPLLLGDKWLDAGPLLAVLSIYCLIAAMKANNHYVYLAVGRPRLAAILALVLCTMLLPALIFASWKWGALGAACAYLAVQILFTPISFSVLRTVIPITLADLRGIFLRPGCAAAVMFGAVTLLRGAFEIGGASEFALGGALAACVLAGVVVYSGVLLALWVLASKPPGAERQVLSVLSDWLVRLRTRGTQDR